MSIVYPDTKRQAVPPWNPPPTVWGIALFRHTGSGTAPEYAVDPQPPVEEPPVEPPDPPDPPDPEDPEEDDE
jgi:hypothetical protein